MSRPPAPCLQDAPHRRDQRGEERGGEGTARRPAPQARDVFRRARCLRAPIPIANRRNEDEQLTKQVQHLFTEKAMLQRRLKELERENAHLHDEVEMLYTQVDEQADEVDAAYERAMRDAANVVVEDFLTQQQELDARREAEVAAARAEADAVRERLGSSRRTPHASARFASSSTARSRNIIGAGGGQA